MRQPSALPDERASNHGVTYAARSLTVGSLATSYMDEGEGAPTLFLHGSGPGASAEANWSANVRVLGRDMRCIAPDLFGFGRSSALLDGKYDVKTWAAQAFSLMDGLAIEGFAVVGNSLGGRIALEMALEQPQRVVALVLMGSGGLLLEPTPALALLRSYEPSHANMRRLFDECFLFDPGRASDEMVARRFEASRATFPEYRRMFSADRRGLTIEPDRLAGILQPALVIHGRDDRVIPVENGIRMARLLPNADLHVFAKCGHWAQFERQDAFDALVSTWLSA